MMNNLLRKQLSGWVRHGLSAIGGAGFVASDSEVEMVVSTLLLLGSLLLSALSKAQQARLAEEKLPVSSGSLSGIDNT